ncbi:hypothetical protein [Amycolatopsis sp. Hca4]|uniref:hypothetical protein n=1 Tax=Amycolatopsis sp. Hca4 TaxID=2742131 RepID=UPI0015918091|nr:hypothetical protein [Amycolatopsis sp. Hca4]QKV75261.1 hypothetical protein HUT10_16920 [Amycolatopsis sp. Hca4]
MTTVERLAELLAAAGAEASALAREALPWSPLDGIVHDGKLEASEKVVRLRELPDVAAGLVAGLERTFAMRRWEHFCTHAELFPAFPSPAAERHLAKARDHLLSDERRPKRPGRRGATGSTRLGSEVTEMAIPGEPAIRLGQRRSSVRAKRERTRCRPDGLRSALDFVRDELRAALTEQGGVRPRRGQARPQRRLSSPGDAR